MGGGIKNGGRVEDIWISPYKLRSKGFLNSISVRREFPGLLIRAGDGYGCIQPWPELGDPSLEKCIEDLKGRRFWPIIRRALRCAEYDEVARRAEESLFEEMEVPESHATVPNENEGQIELAIAAGFKVIKIKAGRDVAREAERMNRLVAEYPQLRWRVDFNEGPDREGAEVFLAALGGEAKRAIDFIEDISPYSEGVWSDLWRQHRVPLAVDRESGPMAKAARYLILKPAVDEPYLLAEGAIRNEQSVVVTSYMDHPLGQTFAAWEAARTELLFPGLVKTCGLQTHFLFEKSGWSERLGAWQPGFTPPGGTGLGFDEELAELTWVKL